MRTSHLVLASVLPLLAAAKTVRAEKVGIVVTGEARLQPQVTSQLERWLHDRGHTVVPGALVPDAINTLVDCFVLEDIGCAKGVVEARASARAIVYARVEQTSNEDGTHDVSITGFWFQKEHEPISERRVCASCTDEKMFDQVDDLMRALVHEPPPPSTAAAPTEKPRVAPPAPALGMTIEESHPPHVLPYGLMGVGALALVGGVVMLAIDEDPEPAGKQSATYRDTGTAGALVTGVGAVALGVGLYLWMTDKPSSHPVAAVSHDGAVVGWTGSF